MQMRYTVIRGIATCSLDNTMSEESLENCLAGPVQKNEVIKATKLSYE